ncbi:MAG: acyl-CoA carboxylase subunit epsilon [Microbacteriaceae bacterium]|nr:acyl-CoA carboxylase subunit epsilon [Microbacteriaceae bacterium]
MTQAPEIRVVRGNPTPDELAAVVSVLEAMSEEWEGTHAQAAEEPASAWASSQRPIRTPIVPGITRWRSFT